MIALEYIPMAPTTLSGCLYRCGYPEQLCLQSEQNYEQDNLIQKTYLYKIWNLQPLYHYTIVKKGISS